MQEKYEPKQIQASAAESPNASHGQGNSEGWLPKMHWNELISW